MVGQALAALRCQTAFRRAQITSTSPPAGGAGATLRKANMPHACPPMIPLAVGPHCPRQAGVVPWEHEELVSIPSWVETKQCSRGVHGP